MTMLPPPPFALARIADPLVEWLSVFECVTCYGVGCIRETSNCFRPYTTVPTVPSLPTVFHMPGSNGSYELGISNVRSWF